MPSDEAPSPPSRRHRRPPQPRQRQAAVQPVFQTSDSRTRTLHNPDSGDGAKRRPLRWPATNNREVSSPQVTGPIASTSTCIRFGQNRALSPTPLGQPATMPSPSAQQAQIAPTVSQLFSDDEVRTPLNPVPECLSSRTRIGSRKRTNDARASDTNGNERNDSTKDDSHRKSRPVKRLRSARANRTMWTQIRQGFGTEHFDEGRSTSEDSVEKFQREVLPLSTARMKRQRQGGPANSEGVGSENDNDASEHDEAPTVVRKLSKRVSTFLGGHELDEMTEKNRRLLLRKAPYRTVSTDAAPLELVSPTKSMLDGSHDKATLRTRRWTEVQTDKDEIQRLRPGQTPRMPFLETMSQTEFASRAPHLQKRTFRPLTDRAVSDREAMRLAKSGSGWISAKKTTRPKRVRARTTKEALEMVDDTEAGDSIAVDTTVRRPRAKPKSTAKLSRAREVKLVKPKYRFVPARKAPPFRPFALQASSHVDPRDRLADSYHTEHEQANASRAPREQGQITPRSARTEFRFGAGSKAKKAPIVLRESLPVLDGTAPVQRQGTVSSSRCGPDEPPRQILPGKSPLPRWTEQRLGEDVEAKYPVRPERKVTLMRRLSTLPGHLFGGIEAAPQQLPQGDEGVPDTTPHDDVDIMVVEPDSILNGYAKSSHSNQSRANDFNRGAPNEPVSSPDRPRELASVVLATWSRVNSTLELPRGRQPAALSDLQERPSPSHSSSSSSRDILTLHEPRIRPCDKTSNDWHDTLSPTRPRPTERTTTRRREHSDEGHRPRSRDDRASACKGGRQEDAGGGAWWLYGPTYSAALGPTDSTRRTRLGVGGDELDLAALRNRSMSTMATWTGRADVVRPSLESVLDGIRDGWGDGGGGSNEFGGDETEVYVGECSTLSATFGQASHRVDEEDEEEEQPPGSMLLSYEA